jgi:hypothetical protein
MTASAGFSSTQDNIVHYASLRMRIVGSGSLGMRMVSQDDIYSQTLVPFSLQAATNIRPTRLMNFQHQRAHLECKTTAIGEWFKINKIVIYAKEVFVDYPSVING